MTELQTKRSDLGVRVASAVVMVAVAGVALWLGGWLFTAFVGIIAFGGYFEWWALVSKLASTLVVRAAWMLSGAIYIGVAAFALVALRNSGLETACTVIAMVIAVDVGAYFAGRAVGGPKIAPAISPSKTWAGLAGGMIASTVTLFVAIWLIGDVPPAQVIDLDFVLISCIVALVAQAGDFLESWMKRRAGVKDSGALIPGHGGLLDRVDGLLAVLCLTAIVYRDLLV